jgi:hypothetical protein
MQSPLAVVVQALIDAGASIPDALFPDEEIEAALTEWSGR